MSQSNGNGVRTVRNGFLIVGLGVCMFLASGCSERESTSVEKVKYSNEIHKQHNYTLSCIDGVLYVVQNRKLALYINPKDLKPKRCGALK